MDWRKQRITGLALISSCIGLACWAENIDLKEVVVTASRIEEDRWNSTRKVEVVSDEDLASSPSQDLAQALTNLTSVDISDYGGPAGTKNLRMRGSNAAQVLVMVDGRPVNSPRDGTVDLSAYALDNVGRIEVMYGPASSLYGSQGMGGAVNIITKEPPLKGQTTELTTSLGSYKTYLERLSQGGRAGKFGYIINTQYDTSDGFRENSWVDAKDINGKCEYEPDDANKLAVNMGYYTNWKGAPGTLSNPDDDDRQKTVKDFVDATWDYRPRDSTGVQVRIYSDYDRLEFNENNAETFFETANKKDVQTTTARGANLQCNTRFSEYAQVVMGYNYVYNLNDSTSSAKHHYTVNAGYIQGQVDMFERLKVSAGCRLDHYSNFGTEWSPSFNCGYNLDDNNRLLASVSHSFRAPTFNDLYWPDEGWAKGNPNLKPERGITVEAGYETRVTEYLRARVTYFRNDFTDLINWEPDTNDVWQPQNIDSAVINGLEVEGTLDMSRHFEFILGYTLLKALDEATNKYLIYQPANKIDFAVKVKELDGFAVSFKGQLCDKRFYDAANDVKVKNFFVFGLDVTKDFKPNIRYFFSMNNLFDRDYQVLRDYPMPGFEMNGGIRVSF
ncbi:MAG: TonB-dependent receptor [Candidatus Omnitrophica bacterium]|nr:TonB-dependent receptor [Candidatus Omnitrophota bacterium]